MRTKVRKQIARWFLFLIIFLFQFVADASSKELPKTKSDWMSFEAYNFSGNSSNYKFIGDMNFKRNGVEVDIKKDTIVFKKNAFFQTNSSLIKLEQNKLIVFTEEEFVTLEYEAVEIAQKNNKIYLEGNAVLKFSNNSTLKANTIIIKKELK